MFGFPDYYDIAGKNEDGACATTIMDKYTNTNRNDIPSIYKYLLGWIDAKIVELNGDTFTEKLQTSSYQNDLLGNQLLIIKLYEGGYERNASTMFYAVEYLTKEYNNNFSGVRVWLIETKNGTLEDWRKDVLSNGNNGSIYVSDHISYIRALSADGKTSYLLKPGMKIDDSTTPAFKIPNGMSYRYAKDGAPHDSVSIDKWRNSDYQLSIDSYGNAARTVTFTLKSLSKNVLTLNYVSDGKTYAKNTYSNGNWFMIKTDANLNLKKTGYLFTGWDLVMKSSDKKYDVTIASFKGGESITPAVIGRAITKSNHDHHPTVYPTSLMEASFSANLVAKWRKAITVTIDPNGGKLNGSSTATTKILPANEIMTLETPVAPSYSVKFTDGTTSVKTMTAKSAFQYWLVTNKDTDSLVGTEKTNDILLMPGNGSKQEYSAVYSDALITLPKALSKSGYIFRGWKDTATNIVYDAEEKVVVRKNMQFTAFWEKTYSYTLTAYKNNTEWKTAAKDGFSAKAYNVNTKESFTLKNTDGTGKYVGQLPIGTYAIYSPLTKGGSVANSQNYVGTYTVSGTGQTGRIDYYSVTLTAGTGIDKTKLTGGITWIIKKGTRTISATSAVIPGYKWVNWTNSSDGSLYSSTNKVTISKISKAVSLKANAAPKTITVQYNVNGGTVSSASHKNGTKTYYHAVGTDKLMRYSTTKAVTASSAAFSQTYTFGSATFDPVNQTTFGMKKTGYKAAEQYTFGGTTGTKYSAAASKAAAQALDKLILDGKTSVAAYAVWTPYTVTAYYWTSNTTANPATVGSKYLISSGTIKNVSGTAYSYSVGYNKTFSLNSIVNSLELKRIGYVFDGWGLYFTGSVDGSANKSINTGSVLRGTSVTPAKISSLITKYISDQKAKKVSIVPVYGTDITKENIRILLCPVWKKASTAFVELVNKEIGSTGEKYQKFVGGTNTGWCASFISYCLKTANDNGILSKNMLTKSASAAVLVNFYKKNNAWKANNGNYTPQPGDLFFIKDSTGSYTHIGIVSSYSNGTLKTIEGNLTNAAAGDTTPKVRTMSRTLKNSGIDGFVTLFNKISLGKFTCTAYCGCKECANGKDTITSSGIKATARHTIAVDPTVIPIGSEVIINGVRYVAEDSGMKGKKVDVFFTDHAAVEKFGVQTLEVILQ